MSHFVDSGITGMVYLDVANNTVIKYPHQVEEEHAIDVEKRIYERFEQHGGHENLLRYYGTYEAGIKLEYASEHGLRQYLQAHTVNVEQRQRWAQDIIEALVFVHSMNVIHADLTCGNVSLDKSLHARLLDFSGSSLDGSDSLVVVTASHRCPDDNLKTIRADLFALGSTLFEIMTGQPPYFGLSEKEITQLFAKAEFPSTENLGSTGKIIVKCWQGHFHSADEVLKGVKIVNLILLLSTDPFKPSSQRIQVPLSIDQPSWYLLLLYSR